jgi:uncharacterized protein YgiM (DUF1202 family)
MQTRIVLMRLRYTILLLALFALAMMSKNARADLAEAERLFGIGKTSEARDLYRAEWLNRNFKNYSDSASFFYNWSVTEWKSGAPGYAIAAAWMAKRATFYSTDLEHNLQWMQSQLEPGARAVGPEYPWWTRIFNSDAVKSEWFWLLSSLGFLGTALLFYSRQKYLSSAIIFGVVTVLIFGIGVSVKLREQVPLAVIVNSNTNLRSGPGEQFPITESLPQGSVLTATQLQENWIQVSFRKSGGAPTFAWIAKGDSALVSAR